MDLNALLAGYTTPLPGAGSTPRLPASFPGKTAAGGTAPSADVFVQGQWWQNQAVSKDSVRQCSCGHCSACGAGAYRRQESRILPASVSSGAASATTLDAAGNPAVSEAVPAPPAENEEAPVQPVAVGPKAPDGHVLSQAEQLQVAQLKQIDTEVRAHELAHLAAAGQYAKGGASFQYQRGPDGQSYAVGGEVQIDTSRERSPEATISKMQTVRAAALAPADPSPQDRKVAAQAAMVMSDASQELRMIRLEQTKGGKEGEISGVPDPGAKVSAAGDPAGPENLSEKNPAAAVRRYEAPGYAGKPAAFSEGVASGALFSSIRITV